MALQHLSGITEERDQWRIECPLTGGDHLLLDHRGRFHDFGGCSWQELAPALRERGCKVLGDDAFYTYQHPDGTKAFGRRYWRKDGRKIPVHFLWRKNGVRVKRDKKKDGPLPHLLYHLPAVLEAVSRGEHIWICEGERDASEFIQLGKVATTTPFGADHWRPQFTEWLSGARSVTIVSDNDIPGYRGALKRYEALKPVVKQIRIVLPKTGKDASDHFTDRHAITDFVPVTPEELTAMLPHRTPGNPALNGSDPLPDEEWTELGYAQRFVEVFGDRVRYVPVWHAWLYRGEKKWARDELNQVQDLITQLVRRMTTLASEALDEQGKSVNRSKALPKETAHSVSSILKLASSNQQVVCKPKSFNAHPLLLNQPAGIYDLRSARTIPHNPDLLLTRMTNGSFNPQASGENFKRFLERVQPSSHTRAFLGRLCGSMLEGRVTEQVLAIFHGTGANGKSTFCSAIDYALGNYSRYIDAMVLRNPDAHPTGIASLVGRRIVFASELGTLDESRVKLLTSQDTLQARRMREDFWDFTPSHNIIAISNERPRVQGGDEGIWRRIQLIPWDVQLPQSEWDTDLSDKLKAESDFILTWLLRGYAQYRKRGLRPSARVSEATSDLRDSFDPVNAFIRECCIRDPIASITAKDIYEAYQKWRANATLTPASQTSLGRSLSSKGFQRKRLTTEGQPFAWFGLSLQ